MTERIVAAACIFNALVVSQPPPARHGNILRAFSEIRPDLPEGPRGQGFLTSTGRYVNRQEARTIAVAAKQCVPQHPTDLFSEDLF